MSQLSQQDIKRHFLQINESIITLISDPAYFDLAEREIIKRRKEIKAYAKTHPEFLGSLSPIRVDQNSPEIIRKMALAARKAEVGPMAAVAGAIAYYTCKAMVDAGARHVIVDNGGDIALYLQENVTIGIYTGRTGPDNLGFLVQPRKNILGICSSSASIGHSLSFGRADVVTMISEDVLLADATATALCNKITKASSSCIDQGITDTNIPDIEGTLVIIQGIVGVHGRIPELVSTNVTWDKITKGVST